MVSVRGTGPWNLAQSLAFLLRVSILDLRQQAGCLKNLKLPYAESDRGPIKVSMAYSDWQSLSRVSGGEVFRIIYCLVLLN